MNEPQRAHSPLPSPPLHKQQVDPEAEMKLASPLPDYLRLLMLKYLREAPLNGPSSAFIPPPPPSAPSSAPSSSSLSSTAAPSLSVPLPPLDSLSRFASFLAYCLPAVSAATSNDHSSSLSERSALSELVCAIRLPNVDNFKATPPSEDHTLGERRPLDGDSGRGRPSDLHTEDYWKRKIFHFLTSLRELKAVPKREKDLDLIWNFEEGRRTGTKIVSKKRVGGERKKKRCEQDE